jgi:hypothetical protein
VYLYKAPNPNSHGALEIKGKIKNMPPEYPDNATAYAALGDSMYYKTSIGDEWFVKVTHEPNAFQFAPKVEEHEIEISKLPDGVMTNIAGQITPTGRTGVYMLKENNGKIRIIVIN